MLNIHWKDWSWSWSSNTLATWCEEPTHWKRSWWWERLKAKGRRGGRGWDGWMASPTQWTWIWTNSRRWWRTGKPGLLQAMGSLRLDMTEQLNTNNKGLNRLIVCQELEFGSKVRDQSNSLSGFFKRKKNLKVCMKKDKNIRWIY